MLLTVKKNHRKNSKIELMFLDFACYSGTKDYNYYALLNEYICDKIEEICYIYKDFYKTFENIPEFFIQCLCNNKSKNYICVSTHDKHTKIIYCLVSWLLNCYYLETGELINYNKFVCANKTRLDYMQITYFNK